jgi:hypothetical protein
MPGVALTTPIALNGHARDVYLRLLGSMYAAMCSRPDIANALNFFISSTPLSTTFSAYKEGRALPHRDHQHAHHKGGCSVDSTYGLYKCTLGN